MSHEIVHSMRAETTEDNKRSFGRSLGVFVGAWVCEMKLQVLRAMFVNVYVYVYVSERGGKATAVDFETGTESAATQEEDEEEVEVVGGRVDGNAREQGGGSGGQQVVCPGLARVCIPQGGQ